MAAEKNFENRLKKYLEEKRCWFIKYWAGAAFTKTGIPDLLVCCNGYFVAIEVKAPNGKASELQKYNIRKIIESGGFGMILYPNQFNEFKKVIEHLQNSKPDAAIQVVDEINSKSLGRG